MKRRLGELLIETGVITEGQLHSALEHQKRFKEKIKLGASLVALGFLTEEKLTHVLSRFLNIAMVDLNTEFISPDLLDLVPAAIAEKYQIMPFKLFEESRKKVLGIAVSDPTNLEPIDLIQFQTSLNIRTYVAAPSDIDRAIQKYYHGILIDGISYVGPGSRGLPGDNKVKIIQAGEEVTWHGGNVRQDYDRPVNAFSLPPNATARSPQRVSTSSTAGESNEMMSEMLKLLREQNALMKLLMKKGIISEDEIKDEMEK